MLKDLLILRFTIFNGMCLGGLIMAFIHGWPQHVAQVDVSHISYAIWLVWLFAVVQQGYKAWKVSKWINAFKAGHETVPEQAQPYLQAQREKELEKVAWMHDAANSLVLLGLLGTIVGFTIAMAGVAGDISGVDAVRESVGNLKAGMAVALLTTLLGGVLNIWIEVNYRLIRTALHNHMCDRILHSTCPWRTLDG